MPSWLLTLLSIITVIIVMAGVLNFPYIPMLFGVYGGDRYSFRGKWISRLIWLFPLASGACLYAAWNSNSYFSLIPFAYIIAVWSIRANKGAGAGTGKQYSTKQENLAERLAEIEYRWASWKELNPTRNYMIFTFFAPDSEHANNLKSNLANTEKLHSEIELSENTNGTLLLYSRISLNGIDKQVVTDLTTRVIDVAWDYKCELMTLDVMEESDWSDKPLSVNSTD